MNRLYWYDLVRMQRFLEQRFREPIDVEDAARAAGYSPWHCRRIFQQYLDESIPTQLRRLRLEAGKRELRAGKTVEQAAFSVGFSSREGFSKAFSAAYGVSPGQYARGEETKERYFEVYEYRMGPEQWSLGANPACDGLWEFSYRRQGTNAPERMRWNGRCSYFEAPYRIPDVEDPAWYCRSRNEGYGLHPGRGVEAVKSFLCPREGVLEYFISLGRLSDLHDGSNPCAVSVEHNGVSVLPGNGALVLSDRQPVFLQGVCRVAKGDRISLCVDAMGHMGRDGVMLYRQRMGYLKEI